MENPEISREQTLSKTQAKRNSWSPVLLSMIQMRSVPCQVHDMMDCLPKESICWMCDLFQLNQTKKKTEERLSYFTASRQEWQRVLE